MTITGRVRDAHDAYSKLPAVLWLDTLHSGRALVDSTHLFRLVAQRRGVHELHTRASGFVPRDDTIFVPVPPESSLVVTLDQQGLDGPCSGFAVVVGPPPILVGVVTDTAGHPIVSARIFIARTDHAALTGRDGHYAFSSIPDGIYTVRAQFIGFLRGEQDSVRIVHGTTRRVDFRLRPATCDIDCDPLIVPAKPKKPPL